MWQDLQESLDPHDVDMGIHELRRSLRWILMCSQFARGQFYLDKESRRTEILHILSSEIQKQKQD